MGGVGKTSLGLRYSFLLACAFLLFLTSCTIGGELSFGMSSDSPQPAKAEVFRLYAVREIPGAFYFKPAVSSKDYALFGYMSKITPTPEELEAEKKRISAIIDESVKQGYGSWENFEKEMGKAGEQAAQQESKEAPSWLKVLVPPSLIKAAVPLLMKGILLYAKAHPEASMEPIGNVGETGVIIVDRWGQITKVPLGLNAPVSSIAISPDERIAAVLTDRSFEDETGRYHRLAEISFIDLNTRTRLYSRIFANLVGHIAFVPGLPAGTYWLAFDYYTGVKDHKAIRFFDFKTRQVLGYQFQGKSVGSNIVFGLDPTSRTPIIVLYRHKGSKTYDFELYDVMSNRKLIEIPADLFSPLITFAHNHPWVFTGRGQWWDYRDGRLLAGIKMSDNIACWSAKFINNDRYIIYTEWWGGVRLFDTVSKTIVERSRHSRDFGGRYSFFTPDERFMLSLRETGKGDVNYKGYLERPQRCLSIIDTQELRLRQKICIDNSTVIDAALAGNMLVVSGFDKLYIYHYLFSPIAQTSGNMYVQNPESMPGVFGSPEKNPFVFEGTIYYLRPGTSRLPDFSLLKPVGKIYTPTLNVPPRNFLEGFPGITNRFEWFAILYRGRIYIPKSGFYTFSLLSDDGSKLIIDGKVVIDNDGIHPPQEKIGRVYLREGIHEIEVPYFQGPRAMVALVLSIIENNHKKIFDIRKFSVNLSK